MGSPVSEVIANLYMEESEEQVITTAHCKPEIWRRYVDDTFTFLDRNNVDGFLHHLNSQQPTIHFTMEIERNNIIPFLETSVTRDTDSLLTTTVYRKPTLTDQYLAYDSHHPQSVKRGIVKCLYNRAKHLITKPSAIKEENTCHQYLFLMDTLPHLYRSSRKQQEQQLTKNPHRNFNQLCFYPVTKVYQRFFAAAYNNKAYALSLNLTQL